MKLFYISLLPLLSTAAYLSRRADFCGQWDTATVGPYIVYNNLWGESSATSGSQCTGVDSSSGNTIAWHTSWSWSGGSSSVKSFANVALQFTATTLADVSSIPTSWSWAYTGSNIDADVAYDMFLSSTPSGSSEYEIMVWLAALGGAGPIGGVISTVNIAGITWQLHSGMNGNMQVFSFVASSETQSFQGDLRDFFTYLQQQQGVGSGLYLTTVQAGTEPFTGQNAVLTTHSYSVTVQSGGSNTGPPSSTTTTTTAPTSNPTGVVQHWGQCGGIGYTGSTTCASPYTCQVQNPYYSQCL